VIYECDAHGTATGNVIHEGKGSCSENTTEAACRGLLEALEYFRDYLSCEYYYVRCDLKNLMEAIDREVEAWDGMPGKDNYADDNDSYQQAIKMMKKIPCSWRRFQVVTGKENAKAIQNATDGLANSLVVDNESKLA
jgi:hypothetical protein